MPEKSAPPAAFRPAWDNGTEQDAYNGQPGTEIDDDQECLQEIGRAASQHDHLPDGRAHLDLVDEGEGDRAAHVTSIDTGADGKPRRGTNGSRAGRSAPGALGSRRCAIASASRSRELVWSRWGEGRLEREAVQVLHDRGLLAGHVPAGRPASWIGTGYRPAACRSSSAWSSGPSKKNTVKCKHRYDSSEKTDCDDREIQYRNRCGRLLSSSRYIRLAGSLGAVGDNRLAASTRGDRAHIEKDGKDGDTTPRQAD